MRFLRRRSSEVDEEIRSHLEMAITDRIANGEDPKSARANALRELGNRTLIEEASRDVWALQTWAESVFQDLRYAARGLRKSPGFTAVAILSLAIGIGGNSAIYSLAYDVLMRHLSVRDVKRLVELLQEYPNEPRGNYWDMASYERIRAQNRFLDRITGTSIDNRTRVEGAGLAPVVLVSEAVQSNYFEAFGIRTLLGRTIAESDAGQPVVVISTEFWARTFRRDPKVAGRQIIIHGVPHTIIGVANQSFTGLRREAKTDLWIPRKDNRGPVAIFGWLKYDVSIEQAEADLKVLHQATIQSRWETSGDPLVRKIRATVAPASAGTNRLRDVLAKPLTALFGLTAIVLLLACVNIATMLLARGAAREREIALRLSLGASRARIVRQLLTECLMLSLLGTAAGALVGHVFSRGLVAMLATGRLHQQFFLDLQPGLQVVGFLAAIATLTTLCIGVFPSWSASNVLRGSSRVTATASRAFVSLQVALSVVLLSAAALCIGHLRTLQGIDLGFNRDNLLLVSLETARSGYGSDRLALAYRQMLRRVEQIPGVRSASMSAPTPLSGAGASGFASVEGFHERADDRRRVSLTWIAPGYFETMGTPLLSGREFGYGEAGDGNLVIVNQTVARYYFSNGENPIGRSITLEGVTNTSSSRTYRIIGVAADANYSELREPVRRFLYLPAFREGGAMAGGSLLIRTKNRPESATGAVREAIREVAPQMTVSKVTTLSDQVGATIVRERMLARLSGFFGFAGAVLAGMGLYGLLAYSVARRTSEIGVRMALGASRSNIARMVAGDASRMVAAGLLAGTAVLLWGRNFAAELVPEMKDHVPVTPLLIGAAAIAAIGLLAAYIPARRASKIDPMLAVRHE